MSRFSQQMRVSTAPISSALRVSSTPKQYLPVSWEISSKYFPISFFSWINFTFARDSAANSIAWKRTVFSNMFQCRNDCKCLFYLIESVLSAVADVHKLNDLGLESLVEHVGL